MSDRVLRTPAPAAAAIVLLLAALAFLLNYSENLQNERIPAGDARRIFLYMEFVDASGELYPLWNPYRLGGFPTLADPDRYIWVAPLVDTDHDLANFQFNALLVLLAGLGGGGAWVLARTLGMGRSASLLTAVLMACSAVTGTHVSNGRPNALLMAALIPLGIASYLVFRRRGSPLHALGAGVCSGLILSTTAHYAFVSYFAPLFLLGWCVNGEGERLSRRLWPATRDCVLVSVLGVGMCAVWIIPLVYYNLDPALELLPESTLIDLLPPASSITNLFLPFNVDVHDYNHGVTFPFVSVLLLPALFIAMLKRARLRHTAAPVFLVLAAASGAVLLGRVLPFSVLAGGISSTPLLWQIRQPGAFNGVLVMSLIFFIGLTADAISNRRGATLFPIAAVALQLAVFPFGTMSYSVPNEPVSPLSAEWLQRDGSYFRTYDLNTRAAILPGMTTQAVVNGFSTRFPPEYRWQLEHLLARPVRELRPHWVGPGHPKDWALGAMNLLNLKYVLAGQAPGRFDADRWEIVVEDESNTLWRRRNWRSSLALVDRWEVKPNIEDQLERVAEPAFDPWREVVLAAEPDLEPDRRGEPFQGRAAIRAREASRMVIDVVSDRNAILFVPENYDPGWKVTIDGAPGRVLRANGSFRGVPVPAGDHEVTLYYSPAIVKFGAAISLATLLAAIGWAFSRRRMAPAVGVDADVGETP